MSSSGENRPYENHGPRSGIAALRRLVVATLSLYKRYVSWLLPPSCRFSPTCSEYARLAVLKHGLLRGGLLACGRLLRCQPLHPGGIDLP